MLITGLTGIAKGTPATITLNKTELFALASVAADAYFSEPLNISKVKVLYKSTVGQEKVSATFDATQVSPTATLSFSLKARDAFTLSEIFLYDFDGGDMAVAAENLPADVNIDFAAVNTPASFSAFSAQDYTSASPGYTYTIGPVTLNGTQGVMPNTGVTLDVYPFGSATPSYTDSALTDSYGSITFMVDGGNLPHTKLPPDYDYNIVFRAADAPSVSTSDTLILNTPDESDFDGRIAVFSGGMDPLPPTQATLDVYSDGEVVFTADENNFPGAMGNLLSISIVGGATSGSESVEATDPSNSSFIFTVELGVTTWGTMLGLWNGLGFNSFMALAVQNNSLVIMNELAVTYFSGGAGSIMPFPTAATATLSSYSGPNLTSFAAGASRNGTTFSTVVNAPAANTLNQIVYNVSGTASNIVVAVTPNDGTNHLTGSEIQVSYPGTAFTEFPQDLIYAGGYLWSAMLGSGTGHIYKLNPTGSYIASYSIPGVWRLALDTDLNQIWAAQSSSGGNPLFSVSKIDIATETVTSYSTTGTNYPFSIAYDSARSCVWVGCGSAILKMDKSDGTILSTITHADISSIRDLVVVGGDVWAVAAGTDKLIKIDATAGTYTAGYSLSGTIGAPYRIAYDAANAFLWIVYNGEAKLLKVSMSGSIAATYVTKDQQNFDVLAYDNIVYVVDVGNSVSRFNATTGSSLLPIFTPWSGPTLCLTTEVTPRVFELLSWGWLFEISAAAPTPIAVDTNMFVAHLNGGTGTYSNLGVAQVSDPSNLISLQGIAEGGGSYYMVNTGFPSV